MYAAEFSKRRRAILGTAALTPFLPALTASRSGPGDPIADAPTGRFLGAKADGIARFLGLRYGRDTGATRFQPPLAAVRAEGLVRAWSHGSICPQRGTSAGVQSEDYLFLNLWTPAPDARARRPVLVYIYGGAYSTGSGNEECCDGARLAARGDAVVVTLTHRLNAFGYLSLGRLDARFPESGNAGQLDLVLALTWIRRNIAAFGGDPDCVTAFGQSGGGAKIATLMAMPAAKGLFHRAITMSGQQVTVSGPQNAARRAQVFLARLASDPLQAPIERMIEALEAVDPVLGGALYFGPVLDGRALTRHPFYPDAHPLGRKIPMMLGNTVAETRAFFPPGHAVFQGLDWTNLAERLGPELRVDIAPELVIARYREWFPTASAAELFIKATTASRSWRAQLIEAEERAKAGVPAFVYQLDFDNAMHTDDIGLVFGTATEWTPAKRALSERMMDAFLRFARTGNPGWPAYDLAYRKTKVFDRESRTVGNPRGSERELFEIVPYIQPGT